MDSPGARQTHNAYAGPSIHSVPSVSARVEINRVYICGHPVVDDDGGVTLAVTRKTTDTDSPYSSC